MEKEKKSRISDDRKTDALEYPIVGKSRAVEQLLKQISRLSKTRNDITIVGEAGVGKGAVAKNIHSMGKPPDDGNASPFMSINLSVLDDRELEAVLFGYD